LSYHLPPSIYKLEKKNKTKTTKEITTRNVGKLKLKNQNYTTTTRTKTPTLLHKYKNKKERAHY